LLRFEESEPLGTRSFFTEIIASISDIKFARGGRYILSRDYMTLKLWDVNMEAAPVATFRVHEYLRPKLCDLYENDSIFDKFECCLSGDGERVATGSYRYVCFCFLCNALKEFCPRLESTQSCLV
jgi:serine/threonine-protein phosphatase 2A regulatory subunit B